MGEDRSLPYGSPLPASWLAAIQEFIGTAAVNFHLSLANVTTVQVTAGANSAQVALGIDGLWRYISATITAATTGAAGLYDIFATTGPNVFTANPGGTPPEIDNTDYSFALAVLPRGSTPTLTGALTNYRKVGELDWDGSHITDLRQTVGEFSALALIAPTSPQPGITPIRAIGAAGQSAPLQTWEEGGTVVAKLNPDGTLTIGSVTLSAALIAAAAGTSGTPSNTNRFVTDSDARVTADRVAGTASIRTLGTGAQQAAPGNDSRILGAAQKAANLSDMSDQLAASRNIGHGWFARNWRRTAASFPAATWTPIAMDQSPAQIDPDGRFSGGWYYPPVAGYYEVMGALTVACGSNPTYLEVGVMQWNGVSAWRVIGEGEGGPRLVGPASFQYMRAQICTVCQIGVVAGLNSDQVVGLPLALGILTSETALTIDGSFGANGAYNWMSVRRVG